MKLIALLTSQNSNYRSRDQNHAPQNGGYREQGHAGITSNSGIPESIKPADLHSYLQKLMTTALSSLGPTDVIDRAHILPKPSHLPENPPRDVIARIHFFHVKGQLMRYSIQHPALPDPFALYTDLSQATTMSRQNLVPITKILQNHEILYK